MKGYLWILGAAAVIAVVLCDFHGLVLIAAAIGVAIGLIFGSCATLDSIPKEDFWEDRQ